MLSAVITRFAGWVLSLFYDVARTGPYAPDGPVLVVANHPNALVDPVVIFRTAGRVTRPLAKAPLFEHPVMGVVLRGLGGLPVYRRQDDPALMHLNERTFDAAIEALQAGGAVQIYPEGRSHSDPAMSPLRTGAARIALMAEERRGWDLGLVVQPVGLTYRRKHLFRGLVVAAFGDPVPVADFEDAHRGDPKEAARALTREIQRRLERLTLNFDEPGDRELVDVAERLYASQKKLARPRERQPMVARLPRLQRFAAGLRWLSASDPERLERLRSSVRRYMRLLTLFGAHEGDVPSRYRVGSVVRYAARQLMMVLLVLPLAVPGFVAWGPPFVVTRVVVPRFRAELDQLATYKLGTALLAFPIWYGMVCAAVFLLGGSWAALAVAVALPIVGLAAIAWHDRQATVLEDFRVFLRARRKSQARDRLAEQRASLVAEFDALVEAWAEDRARMGRAEGPGADGGPRGDGEGEGEPESVPGAGAERGSERSGA